MSPSIRERFDERRNQRALEADEPGAPPGYLLDPEDHRVPFGVGAAARCAEPVAPELWDTEGDLLARGYGEDDGV